MKLRRRANSQQTTAAIGGQEGVPQGALEECGASCADSQAAFDTWAATCAS